MSRPMKDSGVEWIGEIPEDWETKRFGALMTKVKIAADSNTKPGSLSYGKVVEKSEEKLPEATKKTYQRVSPGDFLINPINLNYDLKSLRTGLSKIEVCVSPAYIVAKPIIGHPDFIKYSLYFFDIVRLKELGAGVRQTVSFFDIAKESIPFPSLQEQHLIASFLDRETSLMDQEVSLIDRKIELLGEYRKALIFEAVTKGLDPSVPMKDSGVEWIGEIPQVWETKRLKEVATRHKRSEQVSKNDEHVENGFPVITPGELTLANEATLPPFGTRVLASFPSPAQSVCVANIASVGKIRILTEAAICNPQVISYETNNHKRFFYYSMFLIMQEAKNRANTTTIPFINTTKLGDIEYVLPPLSEQNLIASFLDRETALLDNEIALLSQKKALILEYRQALIFEAVTGKIDLTQEANA